jgi:hypothetical protein
MHLTNVVEPVDWLHENEVHASNASRSHAG